MRLQVFLSHNGVCSRRDAMDIIKAGRVRVNDKLIKEPSTEVTGQDKITVDGQIIKAMAYTYIMLHKPAGYTTTKDDPHAEKTVMELLPANYRHVSPIGRLDKDTEGLLLLTNDGALNLKLTHPKFHMDKTYEVVMDGQLPPEKKKRLEEGVILEGRKTAPCRIEHVRYNKGQTLAVITIHEGRKRQIRLMFYAMGHKVKDLKRIAVGTLTLGDLKLGQWRLLNANEIRQLQA